jgi:hypothetical protein
MSIVDEKSTSRISSRAFDLLGCFVNGLDDVVYHVAEHIARLRVGKMDPAESVEVETEDVVKAGKTVIDLLRDQISHGQLGPDLTPTLDQVERCFLSQQEVG